MRNRINSELILGVVIFIAITVYTATTFTLGPPFVDGIPSSSLWPFVLAVIAYPACLVILVRAYTKDGEKKGITPLWKYSRKVIIATCLAGLYVVLFASIGYEISTFLLCFGFVTLLEYDRKKTNKIRLLLFSTIAAIALTISGYVLFELVFEVRLPGFIT